MISQFVLFLLRLKYLHEVLSCKQIEAIKSIQYPLAIVEDGEPLRLNIDENEWRGDRSQPVSNGVRDLSDVARNVYITLIMDNKLFTFLTTMV